MRPEAGICYRLRRQTQTPQTMSASPIKNHQKPDGSTIASSTTMPAAIISSPTQLPKGLGLRIKKHRLSGEKWKPREKLPRSIYMPEGGAQLTNYQWFFCSQSRYRAEIS